LNFTFGLITDGREDHLLRKSILSILAENIPDFEIIVVGNTMLTTNLKNLRIIPFDETKKNGWITRKKNLITQFSSKNFIVFCHSYIYFCPGWYSAYIRFNEDFDICMNRILNYDGTRFRDWLLWWENFHPLDKLLASRKALIPYAERDLVGFMYISGSYWVAKTTTMLEHPLNERLGIGEGEDVEWSKRVRTRVKYLMNERAAVRCMRQKEVVACEPTTEELAEYRKVVGL